MVNSADKIPIKSSNISIYSLGDNYLLHETNYGHRLRVNWTVIRLLELVDGKSSISLIRKRMASCGSFTENEIHSLLYDTLGKFGFIVMADIRVCKISKPDYLKLSFTLIGEKNVTFLASHIKWLFSRKSFFLILCITGLTLSFVQYKNFEKIKYLFETMSIYNWFGLMLFAGVNLFIHEFGHASSCKAFGAKPGGIGFGFYLLTPVMYADVSDVWKLPKIERIIVNLSGIYMEMLLGCMLVLIYTLTQDSFFLILSALCTLSFFTNLNPFLKYDGYWILTDISGCHNLRKQSNKNLKRLFENRGKTEEINVYLAIYAAIANMLIVAYVMTVLIVDSNGLLDFPKNLVQTITKLFKSNEKFSVTDFYPLIIPTMFYYFIIKFFVSNVVKVIKNSF